MQKLPLLTCVCLVLVLGACSDEPSGPDYSDPQVVFSSAMRAVHDGDWLALEGLLTKDARFALEGDLRRLQKNLAAPQPDAHLMKIVRHAMAETADEEVKRAVAGGMPEMLRFFVKLSPRGRDPGQRGMAFNPRAQSIDFLYMTSAGEQRAVKLLQTRGRWYVARLPL
jgi:hypothetical protein